MPQPGHRLLDEDLCARVDAARRLVEDEDRRVCDERPGDRDELLLAGRDVGGVLVDHGVVPLRLGPHEVIDVRGLGGGSDLLARGAFAPVRDVVPDRPGEQPRVLKNHAECPPHVVTDEVARVDAIEQDASRVDLVETHEKVDYRRLARTGRADDRDGLTRRDREAEVCDQRLLGLVLEAHGLEIHPPVRVEELCRLRAVRLFLLGVQQGEHPLGRGNPRLQQVHLACHLGDRHRELAGVLDEGLHVPERERARRDAVSPDDRYHHVVQVGKELHRRLYHT